MLHEITSYPWPEEFPRSADYRLCVNGCEVDVLSSTAGGFANFAVTGQVNLEISLPETIEKAVLRPLRHGIKPIIADQLMSFDISGPVHLVVEIPGLPDLFIFADEPDKPVQGATMFSPGEIHDIGVYEPSPGEKIHIPGGAVIRGAFLIKEAEGVEISGRGIIDNIKFTRTSGNPRHSVYAVKSDNVSISGITCINSQCWTVKTSVCKNAEIENIKILATESTGDGIDICASEDIAVQNCFVRSGDDCYAVKSVEYGHGRIGYEENELCRDVRNIRFENCAALSYGGGSAMEMGHEFRCKSVLDVLWKDIDVLGVHDYGSAFSIRNCDGALIENVSYENIRVEHHYNELIGFRIIRSRYSRSREPGRVRNITLRNVDVAVSDSNPGYSLSHIGGYDAEHRFENISFENFCYDGRPVSCLDDFDCYIKHAAGISFDWNRKIN